MFERKALFKDGEGLEFRRRRKKKNAATAGWRKHSKYRPVCVVYQEGGGHVGKRRKRTARREIPSLSQGTLSPSMGKGRKRLRKINDQGCYTSGGGGVLL